MKHLVYPTKALREQDFCDGNVLVEHWNLKADYAWDTGIAIGRYLEGLKNGQLLGRYCGGCGRTMIPPRMFCEQCFRPTDEWVPLESTGRVITYSLCYVRWDMERLKEPEIPAVIGIDGASRGMGILHLLGEVDPQAVKIGLAVEAVWKPSAERTGDITDIRYWRPIGGGQ